MLTEESGLPESPSKLFVEFTKLEVLVAFDVTEVAEDNISVNVCFVGIGGTIVVGNNATNELRKDSNSL